MVQPTHDRKSDHLIVCILRGKNRSEQFRYLLRNPLMGSCLVEVGHIGIEHALELLLLQDEQMIEALTSHTAQEAFTDGIGSRGVIRRFDNLDATGLGNSRIAHAKLAIIIPNEIFRPHAISSGLPKLLGGPRVGGRARHADVDHAGASAVR
jgi:hypothetical protein